MTKLTPAYHLFYFTRFSLLSAHMPLFVEFKTRLSLNTNDRKRFSLNSYSVRTFRDLRAQGRALLRDPGSSPAAEAPGPLLNMCRPQHGISSLSNASEWPYISNFLWPFLPSVLGHLLQWHLFSVINRVKTMWDQRTNLQKLWSVFLLLSGLGQMNKLF